jgi:hypothetical protein
MLPRGTRARKQIRNALERQVHAALDASELPFGLRNGSKVRDRSGHHHKVRIREFPQHDLLEIARGAEPLDAYVRIVTKPCWNLRPDWSEGEDDGHPPLAKRASDRKPHLPRRAVSEESHGIHGFLGGTRGDKRHA